MIRYSMISLLLMLLYTLAAKAQEYSVSANVENVKESGFYRIRLPADLRAKLDPGLGDLRLSDNGKYFVPYIIGGADKHDSATYFLPFQVEAQKTDTAGNTEILITLHRHVLYNDRLTLELSDAAVRRKVSVAGSYDRKQWFAIAEDMPLNLSPGAAPGIALSTLRFPVSVYPHLRLTVYNDRKAPLRVIGAGIFTGQADYRNLSVVAHHRAAFFQNDSSDGNSYIRFRQQDRYPVDGIWMHWEGASHFERQAVIYALNGNPGKQTDPSFDFVLDSRTMERKGYDAAGQIDLPATFSAKELLLIIRNGDNPPLKLRDMSLLHKPVYLFAWLDANKSYRILGGSKDWRHPVYDLEQFRDSVLRTTREAFVGPVSLTAQTQRTKDTSDRRIMLWTVIAATIAVIGYLAWNLVREMGEKKEP